jgi:hypothetical protein
MNKIFQLLSFFALAVTAQAKIIYVDVNATGLDNGTSWTNAYANLQDAIADADATPGSDLICVSEGTYFPGTTTSSVFSLRAMTIVGGYDASANDDWRTPTGDPQLTVLSGEIGTSANTDNCSTVVAIYSDDDSAPVRIRGFRITGAYGYTGLYVSLCSTDFFSGVVQAVVEEIWIDSCTNTSTTILSGGGSGGMTVYFGTCGIVPTTFWGRDINISACSATSFGTGGAGFYGIASGANSIDSVRLQNMKIEGCDSVSGHGGLLYALSGDHTAKIANCYVVDNSGGRVGGIATVLSSAPTIDFYGLTVVDNVATNSTPLAHQFHFDAAVGVTCRLSNSIFWGPESSLTLARASGSTETCRVRYSVVKGGLPTGFSSGGSSIYTTNPNLTSDYKLTSGSVAVDAGGALSGETITAADVFDLDGDLDVTELIPFDFFGNTRVVNSVIDCGAHELQ